MGNCLQWLRNVLTRRGQQHNIGGRRVRQQQVIAEGGYGYIWRVQDTRTGESYALKKMICQVWQEVTQSPETRQNFENEAQILQTVADCEYIIRLYGVHRIQRDGYLEGLILMELADRTLLDLLLSSQSTPLTQQRIISILIPVCKGIQALHSKGITHRDIKVQNILLTRSDTLPKLCDFGSASKQVIELSKISKSQLYSYEEVFEKNTTLMYRPPEMIDLYLGYRVDTKVDVWMLGCVVYTMNYYVHPFQDTGKLAIVNANYRFLQGSRVSDKMKDFIRHLLTPDPSFRPNINQVLDILQHWSTQQIILNDVAAAMKQNDINIQQGNYTKFNTDFRKLKKKEQTLVQPTEVQLIK